MFSDQWVRLFRCENKRQSFWVEVILWLLCLLCRFISYIFKISLVVVTAANSKESRAFKMIAKAENQHYIWGGKKRKVINISLLSLTTSNDSSDSGRSRIWGFCLPNRFFWVVINIGTICNYCPATQSIFFFREDGAELSGWLNKMASYNVKKQRTIEDHVHGHAHAYITPKVSCFCIIFKWN